MPSAGGVNGSSKTCFEFRVLTPDAPACVLSSSYYRFTFISWMARYLPM